MSKYTLPNLPFAYNALEPHMSKEQLTIHHDKHHNAYINGANDISQKLTTARKNDDDIDVKSTLKSLSWNIGGAVLHTLFWNNLAPENKTTELPKGMLLEKIDIDLGGFDRFKKEFTQNAMSIEGSGWTVLVYDLTAEKLELMQIEKHNSNIYPGYPILMVLDMFEHAYYIDYKNDKAKYVEAFWHIASWEEVNKRLEEVAK
ncbi:superoxide dismutase [Patescibacteria group bacterium]|nr:superoxide dismutase [Patescibacteria group bacterium]